MKVVIDTNGLLSAIPENGSYKWLYYAFMNQEFTWVVSNEILTEYAEMATNHFGKLTTQFVLQSLLLSANHLRYEPSYKWQLVTTDPDDNRSGEPQIRRLCHRCQCRLFSHQRQAHS